MTATRPKGKGAAATKVRKPIAGLADWMKVRAEIRKEPAFLKVSGALTSQASEIERLREALAFYADGDNYLCGKDSRAQEDCGRKAYAALADPQEGET